MSDLVHWTGGLVPMNVKVIRKSGTDLLPGEWEVRTPSGAKVIVRETELTPVHVTVQVPSPLGGVA